MGLHGTSSDLHLNKAGLIHFTSQALSVDLQRQDGAGFPMAGGMQRISSSLQLLVMSSSVSVSVPIKRITRKVGSSMTFASQKSLAVQLALMKSAVVPRC